MNAFLSTIFLNEKNYTLCWWLVLTVISRITKANGYHTTSHVKPNDDLKYIILLFLVISRLADRKIPANEKIVGDLELV